MHTKYIKRGNMVVEQINNIGDFEFWFVEKKATWKEERKKERQRNKQVHI